MIILCNTLVWSDIFFTISTTLLIALSQWSYLDYLTYNGPIYKSQAKYFRSQSLLSLLRQSHKCMLNQFRTMLVKRQISLSFILIIKLTIKMAAVYKITFFPMRIEPTRPIASTLRAYQVYKLFQNHQKAITYLNG